ncbi:MAG: photosynthetic complex putative assembly protein PuhB [Paracoccaceae bacterium]
MSDHDDFAVEPVPGLPEAPPKGESVLWQGRPDTWALAKEALGITWVAGYFVLLAIWRATAVSDGTPASILAIMLPYLIIGLVTCTILLALAAIYARTTVYTLTTARVAMRIGAALTVTLNLPYRQIANASLDLKRTGTGTGTIALETLGDTRLSYLVCWPHVRPWALSRTQPALRCIPDAAKVAQMLAEAAETRINTPIVTIQPLSLAAE